MLTLAEQITYFLLLHTIVFLDKLVNFAEMSIEHAYEKPVETALLLAATAVFLQYLNSITSQAVRNNNRTEEDSTAEQLPMNNTSILENQTSSSEGASEEEIYKNEHDISYSREANVATSAEEDVSNSELTDDPTTPLLIKKLKNPPSTPPQSSLYGRLYPVLFPGVKTENVERECKNVIVHKPS